jgi:hypothetical protein
MPADLARKFEGIAGVIGEFDHFIALIVMAEDHHAAAERRFGERNPAVHLFVGQAEVSLRQRLPVGDVFLFVRRENWEQHGSDLFRAKGLRPEG